MFNSDPERSHDTDSWDFPDFPDHLESGIEDEFCQDLLSEIFEEIDEYVPTESDLIAMEEYFGDDEIDRDAYPEEFDDFQDDDDFQS